MKRLISALLVCASVSCPALETPLILRMTGNMVINTELLLEISPNVGVMNYYRASQQSLERAVGAPFLLDLEVLDKRIIPPKGAAKIFKSPLSTLREGSANCKPGYEAFLAQFPTKKVGDKPSLQEMALAAEDAFYSKPHEFDGIVRAAWNGDFAVLCIPSKHAILIYSTSDQAIALWGFMSYGPELLVTTGYNTRPNPQELFQRLPPLLQKKILAEQKKKELEDGTKIKETPHSDAWVGAAQNNTFLIADPANNILFTIQMNGKSLSVLSVRNISYDLMLPPQQNFNSDPDSDVVLGSYIKKNQRLLAAAGLNPDPYWLRAYIAANTHGKASQTGLQANTLEDKVVLDFTDRHKLFTYSLSSSSLDLLSSRDYSMDLAVSLLDEEIEKRATASEIEVGAHDNAKSHEFAIAQLKFAFALDPSLVDKVEKDVRLVAELKKEADWGPLLDQAHKDKDAAIASLKQVAIAAQKLKEEDARILKGEPEAPSKDAPDAPPKDAPDAPPDAPAPR